MNRFQVEQRIRLGRLGGLSFGPDFCVHPIPESGAALTGVAATTSGDGFELGHRVLQELQVTRPLCVLRLGELQPHEHQAIGGQPRADGLEIDHAADEKRGGGHRGDGECDLCDNQATTASTHVPAAVTAPAAAKR